MRRFYEYFLLAALIFVAVVTAVAVTTPPTPAAIELDRPGADPVAIWEGYTEPRRHPIDGARGCLTLDDGSDFVCLNDEAGAGDQSDAAHPPA